MALQKNLALIEWAMMAVGLAGAAVDDLGPILTFTIGVDASVVRWAGPTATSTRFVPAMSDGE
jgi:hypothetical protein